MSQYIADTKNSCSPTVNSINNPSLKMVYEMGNIVKGFKKYDLSIEYYSKVLSQIDS